MRRRPGDAISEIVEDAQERRVGVAHGARLDDAIADALRAHPERFYVLAPAANGRTVLRFAAPGRCGGVDIGDLEEFLLRHAP